MRPNIVRFEQPTIGATLPAASSVPGRQSPSTFGSFGGINDADDAAWWQRRYAAPGVELADSLSEESDSEHDVDDDEVPQVAAPAPSPGRAVRSAAAGAGASGRTPTRPKTGTAAVRSQLRAYVTGRCDSDNNE